MEDKEQATKVMESLGFEWQPDDIEEGIEYGDWSHPNSDDLIIKHDEAVFLNSLVGKLIAKERQEAVKSLSYNNDILLCDTCISRKGSRIGGQAITSWTCKGCSGGHVSSSTAHESLCISCSIKKGKCMWCAYNSNQLKDRSKEEDDE